MPIQIQGNSGITQEVEATYRAARVSQRPFEALGYYSIGIPAGPYAALGAGAILFSMRWSSAVSVAVITNCTISVLTSIGFTAAQRVDRDLVVVRSFTVSDTGQTAVSFAADNTSKRTSYPNSAVGDMRYSIGGAVSAGTGTADANPIGVVNGFALASATGQTVPTTALITPDCPIILAQNEGIRVRIITAQGAGGFNTTFINLAWAECTTY